jgi:hypothetical protein
VDQNIGIGKQALKLPASLTATEIQSCAALSQSDIGNHARFFPVWRVNTENIGAKTSKEAGRDWSCQNARQIEHPNAAKRAH